MDTPLTTFAPNTKAKSAEVSSNFAEVEARIFRLAEKPPVRVIVTSNVASLSGAQTLDTVSCVADNRVCLAGQTDHTQNGLWDLGTAGWTRSNDADTAAKLVSGTAVRALEGSHAGRAYYLQTLGTIIPDITAQTWAEVPAGDAATLGTHPAGDFQLRSEKGNANGYASLDSGGKVPTAQLPAAVVGAVNYQGTWNASTNSPALASGTGTKGYYYRVATAGTTALDGISDWKIGDWVIYDGAAWQKVDNTDQVVSVNGQQGTVVIPDFVASGGSHAHGLVPDPGASASTTKYLREDATWDVPPGTGGLPSGSYNNFLATPADGSSGPAALRPIVPADVPTMVGSGGSHAAGIVPDPGSTAGTRKFLRETASWTEPPDFVGDSGSGGESGYVPAPTAGDAAVGNGAVPKLLSAGGGWVTGVHSYVAVGSGSGFVSSPDFSLYNHIQFTASGDITLGNVSGATDGQRTVWEIKQDGTGGHAVALDTGYVVCNELGTLTWPTGANERALMGGIYNATDDKVLIVAFATFPAI